MISDSWHLVAAGRPNQRHTPAGGCGRLPWRLQSADYGSATGTYCSLMASHTVYSIATPFCRPNQFDIGRPDQTEYYGSTTRVPDAGTRARVDHIPFCFPGPTIIKTYERNETVRDAAAPGWNASELATRISCSVTLQAGVYVLRI